MRLNVNSGKSLTRQTPRYLSYLCYCTLSVTQRYIIISFALVLRKYKSLFFYTLHSNEQRFALFAYTRLRVRIILCFFFQKEIIRDRVLDICSSRRSRTGPRPTVYNFKTNCLVTTELLIIKIYNRILTSGLVEFCNFTHKLNITSKKYY